MFEGGHNFTPCCSVSSGRVCGSDTNTHSSTEVGFVTACLRAVASVACGVCFAVSGMNSEWLDIDSFTFVCNYPNRGSGFFTRILVCLTQCITCCRRPFERSNDLILTTNSVVFSSAVIYGENCMQRMSRNMGSCFVCWVPLRQVASHKSSIYSSGAHSSGQCCCGLCCTLPDCTGTSRYTLEVFTRNGFSFSFTQNTPFKNWLEDVDFMSVLAMLGVLNMRAVLPVTPIDRA